MSTNMKNNNRKRKAETSDPTKDIDKDEEVIKVGRKQKPKTIQMPTTSINYKKRLVVVLDKASLQTVKHKGDYKLMECDRHKDLMQKNDIDPSTCRPDICHQSLMMLLDSPLNKAGLLQVYIRTSNNILIEVHPQTKIPRTFVRFAGLMVQLLHKYKVRAADGPVKLLKVIKNDLSLYLPTGCPKIGTSYHTDNVVDFRKMVPKDDKPFVVVVGAMAHGSIYPEFVEKTVSISNYPLSAALVCAKICSATEEVWGVQ